MKRTSCLLLALVGGCTWFARSPQPSTTEGAWAEQRDRYTRECKVYNVLSDVVFATATYQAPSVRIARVNRLAEWKGMLPSEREVLLSKERAEGLEFEEFLLSFYTDNRGANDLATDHGTWRVALVVDSKEQAPPVKIDLVRADPTTQVLYPYVSDFYRLYRIRFPHFPGDRPLAELPFTLLIAGAPARVEMEWKPGSP